MSAAFNWVLWVVSLSIKSAEIGGGLMVLDNVIDTLLNLWVFAFIGILVWLYFKKESDANKAESQERDIESWAYKLFS